MLLSSRKVLVLEDQFTSTCPSTSSPCPCPQNTSPCPRLEDQFTSACPSTSSPCPCPQTTSPCPRTLSPSQHHCMQHFQPVKPESALQKVIHRQQLIDPHCSPSTLDDSCYYCIFRRWHPTKRTVIAQKPEVELKQQTA